MICPMPVSPINMWNFWGQNQKLFWHLAEYVAYHRSLIHLNDWINDFKDVSLKWDYFLQARVGSILESQLSEKPLWTFLKNIELLNIPKSKTPKMVSRGCLHLFLDSLLWTELLLLQIPSAFLQDSFPSVSWFPPIPLSCVASLH